MFCNFIHIIVQYKVSISILLISKEKWLTISGHSECQTFLQSTSLTSVSIYPINQTSLLSCTMIVHNWTLWSSKKSFATFTCNDTIMHTARFISTHLTRDDLNLGWNKTKIAQVIIWCTMQVKQLLLDF